MEGTSVLDVLENWEKSRKMWKGRRRRMVLEHRPHIIYFFPISLKLSMVHCHCGHCCQYSLVSSYLETALKATQLLQCEWTYVQTGVYCNPILVQIRLWSQIMCHRFNISWVHRNCKVLIVFNEKLFTTVPNARDTCSPSLARFHQP